MRESTEPGTGRGRTYLRLAPLALFLLALHMVVAPRDGEAHPAGSTSSPDTLRTYAPRLFERRVVFSPEFLVRVLDAARGGSSEIVVEVEAPSQEPLANVYARRYRISRDLALLVIESARAEGIDPDLAFRLVRVESVFRTNARGKGGALGLTQLMPSTARAIDRSLRTEAQILEPITNLRTGFRYLRRMIERYDGDVRLGLLAYNRGEGTVDRALRTGRDPENGYSSLVLEVGGSRYSGRGVLAAAP